MTLMRGPASLPLPAFVDLPRDAASLHVERAAEAVEAARTIRAAAPPPPTADDRPRIAAFGIDVQVGFAIPGASLFVPGAPDDTARTVRWLYANAARLTRLYFSLDTHAVFQIFHPSWWRDAAGNPPAPLTVITPEDVRAGRWIPRFSPDESRAYVDALAARGKYVLTIWPFHTLLGGTSHALVPAVMEAALFHATLRDEAPVIVSKGTHPLTESYSVMSPEVTEVADRSVGEFDAALFDALFAHDHVYVYGQAKSHCVLSTLEDLVAHAERVDPALVRRLAVLVDATSPVPAPPLDPLPPELDFPRVAEAAFERLARRGVRLVRTTDPLPTHP